MMNHLKRIFNTSSISKYLIFLIVLIIVLLGSTLAYYSWGTNETNKTNVAFEVVADSVYIYYDAGTDITGVNLYPTDDKNDGIKKDITIKSNSNTATFNLYLDLNTLPNELKDISFRYAIYKDNTFLKEGSITDATEVCETNNTNHIVLLSNENTSKDEVIYSVYLWIDGTNYENPDTMMNQTFEFALHADGENATLVNNLISIISMERDISTISNITLQSYLYEFDSYGVSSSDTVEPTTWTSIDCSNDSCATSKTNIYEKELTGIDFTFTNGVSYLWLKNTNGDIVKLEIGKSFTVTLDSQSATTTGTSTIYGIYNDSFYLDSALTQKIEVDDTITIPGKNNYDFGGYYTGTSGAGTQIIDNTGKIVSNANFTDDVILYAKWVANAYNVTYDCTTNGGTTSNSTTSFEYGTNADLSKTCSKDGWTFVGWNINKDATTKLDSYTVPGNDSTLYAIYRKEAVTLTAKWNANGATLSSTSDSTCTLEAVYNNNTQATSCTLTAPTITRSGYTIVGFDTSASSTTNNSSYNTSSNLLTVTTSNTGTTWYAITYATLSSNFYYYNGSSHTSTTASCTVYNTDSLCTYTLPTIVSSSTGPNSSTYYGVSTATSSSSITTTYNSSTSNYYAVYQDKLTASYTKDSGVASIGSTSNSCNNYQVSNGSAYSATSCSVTLPSITASDGFVALGWYNSSSTKVGDANTSITLTSNQTFTAKARNLTASELSYDNTNTGEDCSETQCMIDRLDTLLESK